MLGFKNFELNFLLEIYLMRIIFVDVNAVKFAHENLKGTLNDLIPTIADNHN